MLNMLRMEISAVVLFVGGLCVFASPLELFTHLSRLVAGYGGRAANELHWCLFPESILLHRQLWRIFTAPFFHAGFLHLVLNMLAWWQMGIILERIMGSLELLFLVLTSAVLSGVLQVFLALEATRIFRTASIYSCTLGLSGVLFALQVFLIKELDMNTLSVFGLFNMPAHLTVYVSLFAIQLFFPRASFLGHLCGILVGYFFCLFPPRLARNGFANLESSMKLEGIPLWRPSPASDSLPYASIGNANNQGENWSNRFRVWFSSVQGGSSEQETNHDEVEFSPVGTRAVNVSSVSRLVPEKEEA